MTLDVRSAAILIECARLGSLGRAAAALDMTQPAVTRMLQRLEDSYRVQLFERTTRGVVPTVYGEALLPYAKLIVSEVEQARNVIDEMRGASRGVVRVGGVASVVAGFIVEAIARMRRDHPDLQFQVIEELEDRLLEALKSGEIDLAMSPEPYADDEITLATPDTFHDEVAAFARAGHPILAQSSVELSEAARQDWALPPAGTPVVREWLRRFHGQDIEPKPPAIVSRSVQIIKSAVLGENMLCWMPVPQVRAELAAGQMVRVPCADLDWRRKFRMYRRRQGLMTPAAAILVENMRRVGQESAHELL
ncbi:MAG: LysR family transcriptional regulator [Nitratireductor sp.]|nr:LysR family transcriptional regulator [Nitratireductor sp.]